MAKTAATIRDEIAKLEEKKKALLAKLDEEKKAEEKKLKAERAKIAAVVGEEILKLNDAGKLTGEAAKAAIVAATKKETKATAAKTAEK